MVSMQEVNKKEALNLDLKAQAIPNTATFQNSFLPEGYVWVAVAVMDINGNRLPGVGNVYIGGGVTSPNKDGFYVGTHTETPEGYKNVRVNLDGEDGTRVIGNAQCFTYSIEFNVNLRQSSITAITIGTPSEFGLPENWVDDKNGICGNKGTLIPNLLSECTLGEIKCMSDTTYNACVDIGAGTYRFSEDVSTCPTGNICSNNECVQDLTSFCNNLRSTAINSINQWAISPTQSSKEAALNALSGWAVSC